MENDLRAKEILEYCANYLISTGEKLLEFKTSKRYKEMVKEIKFLMETS